MGDPLFSGNMEELQLLFLFLLRMLLPALECVDSSLTKKVNHSTWLNLPSNFDFIFPVSLGNPLILLFNTHRQNRYDCIKNKNDQAR